MKRRKDPPDYEGDDAMNWAFSIVEKELRAASGLSDEQIAENIKKARTNPVILAFPRAFGLRLRAVREERKMSRPELADTSNVPVRMIVMIERGVGGEAPMGDVFRLCLGLKYDVLKFYREIEQEARRLAEEDEGGLLGA
jgi:DNA-binding XRE family transcriptional regulator